MLKELFKKSGKCKTCSKRLPTEYIHIGFCAECAVKEIVKLKKRIRISSITGAALMVFVFAAIYYARTTAFISNLYGYKGDIFVPFFSGHLAFNARAFNSIANLSVLGYILLAFVCFLIPFGSYVRLEFDTYRRKAEIDLYMSEPLTGNIIAGFGKQRLDGIGFFVIELILSALSGPFFFIYRLYKLWQLSNCVKEIQVNNMQG